MAVAIAAGAAAGVMHADGGVTTGTAVAVGGGMVWIAWGPVGTSVLAAFTFMELGGAVIEGVTAAMLLLVSCAPTAVGSIGSSSACPAASRSRCASKLSSS